MQGSQRVGKPGKGREFLEARSRSGKDWEFQENYVGSGKGLENKKKRARYKTKLYIDPKQRFLLLSGRNVNNR